MFELSVALKYLIPRWRQLSVSIISLISIGVIALVVWLILVFFSVTHGLESAWVDKLVALTAPVRMTPTEAYYRSYYYKIDALSEASDYTSKRLGEKLQAKATNPYNPSYDEALPSDWPHPDVYPDGSLRDLVKLAYKEASSLQKVPGIVVHEYETTMGNLQIKRPGDDPSYMNYTAYFASYNPENRDLERALLTKNLAGKPLPKDRKKGEGIILPKSFREAGVQIGDTGVVSYTIPTASSMQEQRLPIFVTGFYDQGVMSLGGKMVWMDKQSVAMINRAYEHTDNPLMAGFNIRMDQLDDAEAVKKQLIARLEKEELSPYWKVETYRDYPFTKEFLQQIESEKNLFSLLALVIIVVACSNIVSMLTILVNDKRAEIGVLRAMGASSASIATIFGFCGLVMGALGSCLGILMAWFTLLNLHPIIQWIGKLQGHDVFSSLFYGDVIPNEMSGSALLFVAITTVMISLIAGVVPAVKASLLSPAQILRAE